MRVVLLILLSVLCCRATIIPADRIYPWQGNVGIPGGITNRTTIFANVKNSPYNAAGNGTTDDTTAIQNALNACPAGQVVYIPTGTYKVTSTLAIKGNYTVRGDGAGLTVIASHITANEVIGFGTLGANYEQYRFGSPGTPVNITGGTSLGSTSITVSSAAGISVGKLLNIDMLNDTNGFLQIVPIGNEGYQNIGSRTDPATRCLGQVVYVTGVSGTTITIDPPLDWYYTNSPQATPFSCANVYAGVENLTVDCNNTGADNNFSMNTVAYCWLKNVESEWADGDHITVDSAARCEIRDSYFHDAYLHTPGSHDSTVRLQSHCSGLLIENNIMRRLHLGLMPLGAGGSASVISYNFLTNQFDSGSTTALYNDIEYHGSHVLMTLFEGNVLNGFTQDGVWGTSSHGTLLRNFISGQDYCNPPFSGRGTETGPVTKQIAGARCVSLAGIGLSKYFNVVGNVLGVSTMGNTPTFSPVYMTAWPTTPLSWDHEANVFALGYAGGSDDGTFAGDNTTPQFTLINHGNWDIVSGTQMFSNNIADHVIPKSYYLASKPAFFGVLNWPPIDPTTATANNNAQITNVPAVYRFFNGSAPPSGSTATPVSWNVSNGTSIQRSAGTKISIGQ